MTRGQRERLVGSFLVVVWDERGNLLTGVETLKVLVVGWVVLAAM